MAAGQPGRRISANPRLRGEDLGEGRASKLKSNRRNHGSPNESGGHPPSSFLWICKFLLPE